MGQFEIELSKNSCLACSSISSNVPFFHVDFTEQQIRNLIQPQGFFQAAGICIVAGDETTPAGLIQNVVYAFRVIFDSSGKNLIRNPHLNVEVIRNAKLGEITSVAGVVAKYEKGDTRPFANAYWRLNPTETPFTTVPPANFVFVDKATLERLLPFAQKGIRIRRTILTSKQQSASVTGSPNESFENYIVESLPTFEEKANTALASSSLVTLTDKDAVSYGFGYPCPPRWQESYLIPGRIGFTIFNRKTLIPCAGSYAIKLGSLIDAIWSDADAIRLLSNWELINRPVKLTISEVHQLNNALRVTAFDIL